jgi:zinc transport system substrate-binding protein
MPRIFKVILIGATIALVGGAAFAETDIINVVVSIDPIKYVVDQVGTDVVTSRSLVDEGQSPETFEITPKQFAELSETDIYFTAGLPFEKTLVKKIRASLPNIKIINCLTGKPDSGDGEYSHDHSSDDPHVWLDTEALKEMAWVVEKAYAEVRPEGQDLFQLNTDDFINRTDSVFDIVDSLLTPYEGKSFYVYHPAFGHFASRFGLKQIAIEDEGKEPGPKHLAELISRMKQERVKFIYIQPQFSQKSARAVAQEIGAELIPLDPLAYNVVNNVLKIGETLARGFAEER